MAKITFEGSRYSIRENESVLDALLRGGANVTFSCRKGSCQVCMLRAVSGDPGEDARRGLREEVRERGYFLPCTAHPKTDLVIERPNLAELFVRARVHEKRPLSEHVVRLLLEPEKNMSWRAGQYINVRRADGVVRSYSIASVPEEDYFLEIHVKRLPGGQMSAWLCDHVNVGDVVEVQGPIGDCFYDPETRDRNLLLACTGTGLSPLVGIVRDALRHGHRGKIFLYQSSRDSGGLYLRDELRGMSAKNSSLHHTVSLSKAQHADDGVVPGRVVDVAFARHQDLSGWVVYLCGLPEMVHEARYRALLAGAERRDIHADPFEYARPFTPNDDSVLDRIKPDPELWAALENGVKLTTLLTDFYTHVYADARLAPFFHGVTKQRAIEKQYEFLASIFEGKHTFFGLKPFNAHHWMVISDELFDYREALFLECLRRHGIPEPLIRRWTAIHELFRRSLVKSSPRGLFMDGEERPIGGYEDETLTFASLCDGCNESMDVGSTGRFHVRTGKLFCTQCAAHKAGMTTPPMAL